MTDTPQQRERFIDEVLMEINPDLFNYDHGAGAFRLNSARGVIRAALSQPAVAGAVDERIVAMIDRLRNFAGAQRFGRAIFTEAADLLADLRLASPSQPAAEGESEARRIAFSYYRLPDHPAKRTAFAEHAFDAGWRSRALRASPADDGETKADAFTRGVAAGMKMAREIDDKMDNLLRQQDKQS